RGMVIGSSTRQDQNDSLAQAHTALGQAKSLASPFLRCCADESGVGGQLIGGEKARSEQDQEREEKAGTAREEDEDRAGGNGERAHEAKPYRRSHEAADDDRTRGLAQSLGRQDHAHGQRAPAQSPGERSDDPFGGVVKRREPAEEHGG